MRFLIVAFSILAFAGSAHAQAPTGDAAKMLGAPWDFSNADRDKVCSLTFKPDRSGSGYALEFDANCGNLFPLVNDIVAWKLPDNDLLRLMDASGKALVEFSEVETGIFEAPTPGVGLLFLQPAGTSEPEQRSAEQMFGDWAVVRAEKKLCVVTLAKDATREGYAIKLQTGCDPAIGRIGFASWSMDRGELLLAPARGNAWRFEEGDAGVWRRVPETPDPITLVRQ